MPPHAPAHRASRRGAFRPAKAVALGVTAVAVLSTAAFASGVFSGGAHTDEALADTTHTGLPDGNLPDGAAKGPAQPSPRSTLATPSPAERTMKASGTSGRGAGGTGSTAGHHVQDAAAHTNGPLSYGDSGPQVTALQQKLGAMYLYHGADNGTYGQDLATAVRIYQMYRHVNGDPPGVYGPNTRRALESEQAPSSQHTGTTSSAGHTGTIQYSGHTGDTQQTTTRQEHWTSGGQSHGTHSGRATYGGRTTAQGGTAYQGGTAGTSHGGAYGGSFGR